MKTIIGFDRRVLMNALAQSSKGYLKASQVSADQRRKVLSALNKALDQSRATPGAKAYVDFLLLTNGPASAIPNPSRDTPRSRSEMHKARAQVYEATGDALMQAFMWCTIPQLVHEGEEPWVDLFEGMVPATEFRGLLPDGVANADGLVDLDELTWRTAEFVASLGAYLQNRAKASRRRGQPQLEPPFGIYAMILGWKKHLGYWPSAKADYPFVRFLKAYCQVFGFGRVPSERSIRKWITDCHKNPPHTDSALILKR